MNGKEQMKSLIHKVKDVSKQAVNTVSDITVNVAETVKENVDTATRKASALAEEKKKVNADKQKIQFESAMESLKQSGFEDFFALLGDSPIKLTAVKISQIKTVFSIPKEQQILWADAEFDFHPSGIVATDYGIYIRTNVEYMDGKLGICSPMMDDMSAEEQQEYLKYFAEFRSGKPVLIHYAWENFDPAIFTGCSKIENKALLVEEQCAKRFVYACIRYTGINIELIQGLDDKNLEKDSTDDDESNTDKTQSTKVKLDDQLRQAVMEYNDAYTKLDANGNSLYVMRTRAVDLIKNIEDLINSIANHPKTFDIDIEEIHTNRTDFTEACEFAKAELEAAKKSAIEAGAGVAAGAAIVSVAPAAAMWIATTFGTASTGTAISALSGAAAQSAALAWLGGGALTAGGGGMAAGHALLAMAGPIGWTIAGATLLASITLFTVNKFKLTKQKEEEIKAIKNNTKDTLIVAEKIQVLIDEVTLLRDKLSELYGDSLHEFGKDFHEISEDRQMQLGVLVNNTKALAATLSKGIE